MKSEFPSQKLAQALGVAMPPAWASLMRIAHNHARTRSEIVTYFLDALKLLFSGRSLNAWRLTGGLNDGDGPTHMPPEFITLGIVGIDAASCGLVVRTPEDPESDPPLAVASSGRMVLLGVNAQEAIENLLAEAVLRRERDKGDQNASTAKAVARKLRQIEDALGFPPSSKQAHRRIDEHGMPRPLPVTPRNGYDYVETCDGVGVHAPSAAFDRSKPPFKHDEDTPVATLIERATTALRAGLPATALLIAKSAWHRWTDVDQGKPIGSILAKAYLALDRPQYAEMAARKMEDAAWLGSTRRSRT